MNIRKIKGFTLLEMLIVVAIISILVAIGIPAYHTSLAKAKEAVCLSNRRSLLSVVYSEYLLENYNSPEEAFNAIYKGDDEKTYVCPEDGIFKNINILGVWWTATVISDDKAWCRVLWSDLIFIDRDEDPKGVGMSIRCVKD